MAARTWSFVRSLTAADERDCSNDGEGEQSEHFPLHLDSSSRDAARSRGRADANNRYSKVAPIIIRVVLSMIASIRAGDMTQARSRNGTAARM